MTASPRHVGTDEAGAHGREVVDAMSRTSLYEPTPEHVELRETAISWVFLAGDLVYKVKKPLVLPFLDYGTLERRHELCEEEVRLNRRLAPDVYLGVVALVRTRDGHALEQDPGDRAIEWAVQMRRLPEERTLDRLLAAGRLSDADAAAVGRRLADFHADAPVAPEPQRRPSAARHPLDQTLQTLLDLELPVEDRRRLIATERAAAAFLAGRRDTLLQRASGGRIRDGHGDLRLEHVLLRDGVEAVDCVEFDPALRQADVGADLAFLVMELVARDSEPLAWKLVDGYRAAGGDPGDDALLAFYGTYRSCVRAELAYLRARDARDEDERTQALSDASVLLAAGERLRWLMRLPLMLAVCGVAASGKSVVAEAIAGPARLPVVESDRVRKDLAGVPATERARPEHYTEEFSRRTYAELGGRAARAVAAHGGVVVDATFRRSRERQEFRAGCAAVGEAMPPVFVECRAPEAVIAGRARRREAQPDRVSDATAQVAGSQLRELAFLDEVDARDHLTVRTDRPVCEAVGDVEALLDRRMAARMAPG